MQWQISDGLHPNLITNLIVLFSNESGLTVNTCITHVGQAHIQPLRYIASFNLHLRSRFNYPYFREDENKA